MTWSGNEGLAYPEKSLTLGSRSSVMLWCAAVPGTSAPSRADELRFPSAGADVRAVADAGSRCCLTGKLADFCQINCRGSLVQGFRMGLCALTRCQITCRDSNRVFATGFDAFLRRVRSILTPILSLERQMVCRFCTSLYGVCRSDRICVSGKLVVVPSGALSIAQARTPLSHSFASTALRPPGRCR